MVSINGDLIPSVSGQAHLGIDGNVSDSVGSFDITTLNPFGHVHMLSGVWHDPLMGESGVMRYSREQAAFQVSVDGGLTFSNLSAGGVDSVGVLGGVNLTGNVDVASVASGFIAIQDTAGSSPLLWSVDQLGLSGLWDFPTQGFNGRVVNALTDDNGTEAQGVINFAGASGIIVDIVGQTLTISPAGSGIAKCYSQDFDGKNITVVHGLDTANVIAQAVDDSSPPRVLIPDRIEVTDANTVDLRFNGSQTGRVTIIGC